MGMYQVPQFLDSGDKIVFGMTVWQLLYAMVGFFLSIGLFSLVNNALPWLGIWSFIPIIPIAGLALFLALGKFNGRDSDIYVLKFILMMAKPRKMMYQRQPETFDLDEKMAQLTPQIIEKDWESRLQSSLQDQQDPLLDFKRVQSDRKAEIIRKMGTTLDDTLYNTLQSVSRKQLEVEAKQDFLQKVRQQNSSKSSWGQFVSKPQDTQQNGQQPQSINLPEFQPSKIKDYLPGGRDFNFFDLNNDGSIDPEDEKRRRIEM